MLCSDDANISIIARPWHYLTTLIPYYLVNAQQPNFQPTITLSKLLAVKSWLESKCSAFLSFQVLNARWDDGVCGTGSGGERGYP